MHDFGDSLRQSHEDEKLPYWAAIFSRLFPGYVSHEFKPEDGPAQRAGVDGIVTLDNGKQFTFDTKVRAKVYDDILLEYYSSVEDKKPGWVFKPLLCDFIVYLFKPNRECHLLPVPSLQAAWNDNHQEWFKTYKAKPAYNGSYTTMNLPIPKDVLYAAMNRAQCVILPSEKVI